MLPPPPISIEIAEASQARIGPRGRTDRGIPSRRLFCTTGVASTACSKILGGFTPTYESTVTANLWREGGVMLGKINCDEFAMGSANETSAFGPAVNHGRRPTVPILYHMALPVDRLRPWRRALRCWRPAQILAGRSASPPPSAVLSA